MMRGKRYNCATFQWEEPGEWGFLVDLEHLTWRYHRGRCGRRDLRRMLGVKAVIKPDEKKDD